MKYCRFAPQSLVNTHRNRHRREGFFTAQENLCPCGALPYALHKLGSIVLAWEALGIIDVLEAASAVDLVRVLAPEH